MQRTMPLARGRIARYFPERTWPRQVTALGIDSLRPFTGSVRNTAKVSLTTYFTMRGPTMALTARNQQNVMNRRECHQTPGGDQQQTTTRS